MPIAPTLLESFILTAREGSFSRASTQLGVSTSSLSDRIRTLEEQLGFPLFHRTTRRTLITRHGREFLGHAKVMLSAIRDVEMAAADISRSARNELVIGAGPYGAAQRREITERFRRRHPEIQITSLIDLDQSKLFALLRNGDIDLMFGWGDGVGQPVERSCPHEVEIGLLVPDHQPLPDKTELRTVDLRGLRILTSSENLDRSVFRALSALATANDIEVVEMPCDHASEMLRYARDKGLAVLGCAEYGTPSWPIDGLHLRRWSDMPVRSRFHLYRDPFSSTPLARRFWNEARVPIAGPAPSCHA